MANSILVVCRPSGFARSQLKSGAQIRKTGRELAGAITGSIQAFELSESVVPEWAITTAVRELELPRGALGAA